MPTVGAQCGSDISDQVTRGSLFLWAQRTVCSSSWLFVILHLTKKFNISFISLETTNLAVWERSLEISYFSPYYRLKGREWGDKKKNPEAQRESWIRQGHSIIFC